MKNVSLGLILIIALASCGGAEDSADQEAADAPAGLEISGQQADDLADITKFRLTMDRMDKYFQTLRNVAEAMKGMTPAEIEAAGMETDNDASLDQMVEQAESNAVIRDAARKAGSSPREYVMTSIAYIQSAMAAAVAQMQPNANQDSLAREMKANPDNIRFIRENEAEIKQKYDAVAAEMKAAGLTED